MDLDSRSTTYPKKVGRLFIVVHSLVEIGYVTLVYFGDRLMVLRRNCEATHIGVNVYSLRKAVNGL